MTDIADDAAAPPRPTAGFRSPEQEQAELGAEVPDADQLPIEQINPVNSHLYAEDRWHEHHARLRAEDPIHFNQIATAGRYWSVTKAADIKAVEADWQTFSSANGITLTIPVARQLEQQNAVRSFIAMDPPEHREQRRTVTPSIQPKSLQNLEPLIRERTIEVLDELPEGETFDWVPTVSIELTTRMLATLFDFPFE
ncbi:MAG: cytochrome P450, partial [Actinomycetota bacterium]